MATLFERVRHALPELLRASAVAAAAFLAKLQALAATSSRRIVLPQYAALASGALTAAAVLAVRRYLRNRQLDRGKGRFRAYPALRGSDDAAGFTAASIRNRLPRIIDDIIATTPGLRAVIVEELRALRLEISSNAVISGLPSASGSGRVAALDADQEPAWPSYDGEPFVGCCTWQSARWFVCETYFYRKIRAIMRTHNGPEDPFAAQKRALLDSLQQPFERNVLALLKSESSLSDAVSQSLLGNKGDLSLHSVAASIDTVSAASSLVILADQRSEALKLLHSNARVAIILDNCGLELVSDLMLAALLLQSDACASVQLLCKKRPVWVSDVLEKDIHQHLDWAQSLKFDAEDSAAANAKFVAWIRTCLLTSRLTVVAHEFLSGPEAFDEMGADLVKLFEGCALAICKGDANYRRLLGDRHVPNAAPFSLLTDYFPCPLLALRTCKAGLVCGVDPDVCAKAESDWLVSGRYAVIQFKP